MNSIQSTIDNKIITHNSRVSLRASLLITLVGWMAPDLGKGDIIEKVVAKDRAKGPAYPPKRLRSKIEFSEERNEYGRFFRAAPRGQSPRAMRIFLLHGGAFIMDLQTVHWKLIGFFVERLNAEVVVPIYPLAPEHTCLESLRMVHHTYLSVVDKDAPKNTIIVGDSAGAALALALTHRLRDNAEPMPAGIVLFSPFVDASVTGADQPELEKYDPVLTVEALRDAGRKWAGDLSVSDPRVSPLFGNQIGLPPMMIFSGTRDTLHSDAKRLIAHGCPAVLHEYIGMMHMWPVAPIPEARRALETARAFMSKVIKEAV